MLIAKSLLENEGFPYRKQQWRILDQNQNQFINLSTKNDIYSFLQLCVG